MMRDEELNKKANVTIYLVNMTTGERTEFAECEVIESNINKPPMTSSEVRDAMNEKLKGTNITII